MASGLKKAMVYLGFAEGEDLQEEETTQQRHLDEPQKVEQPAESEKPAPVTSKPAAPQIADEDRYPGNVTPIKRVSINREEAQEVHQLTTIHPRSYNDAKLIGEAFRSGIPVIMNVTDMSDSEAKRLVDFSAGLVFGLYGSIERVTNKVFLLTPQTVEVITEGQEQKEADTAFFNQA